MAIYFYRAASGVVRLAAEMAGRAPRGAAIEDHCKSAGRAWVQCP